MFGNKYKNSVLIVLMFGELRNLAVQEFRKQVSWLQVCSA